MFFEKLCFIQFLKTITWKGTSPSYKPAIFAGSQRRVSLSILNLSIQNTFQIQYLYFSRYRPNTIAGLCEATGFSPQEVSLTKLTIQLMLIIFKQVCDIIPITNTKCDEHFYKVKRMYWSFKNECPTGEYLCNLQKLQIIVFFVRLPFFYWLTTRI